MKRTAPRDEHSTIQQVSNQAKMLLLKQLLTLNFRSTAIYILFSFSKFPAKIFILSASGFYPNFVFLK